MRMAYLVRPLNPELCSVAEQTLTLLSGAYMTRGGLVGTPTGSSVTANASKCGDNAWSNVVRNVARQNVFLPNVRRIKNRLKIDQFLEKY